VTRWNPAGAPDWQPAVDPKLVTPTSLVPSWVTRGPPESDSGGPLVTHDGAKLVGVTNWVSGAGCQAGHPAGFQRVTYHLDWIRDRTGIAYY